MRKLIELIILTLLFLLCCGRNGNVVSMPKGNEISFSHSRNLKLEELSPGVTLVSLKNPWDTTTNIAVYLLEEKGKEYKGDLPKSVQRISVPLQRAVVYSGVHVSLIDELGGYGAVKGICDAQYIHDPKILGSLKEGKIEDCGNNLNPNVERIISLQPDAVMLSPYESSDATAPLSNSPLKTILTIDYMEKTPLGRAEWMRFYGRLFGKGAEADSLFKHIEGEYEQLKRKAATAKYRPSVLFDRLYSGLWDVPTASSVTGNLIEDAGGYNPFRDYRQGGAARLAAEEVLLKGREADIWCIRYIEPQLSKETLQKDNAIYSRFKAFKEGNVWGVNTMTTNYFEDGAFHPNETLREMLRLLHPELETTPLKYFHKL